MIDFNLLKCSSSSGGITGSPIPEPEI